MLYILDDKSHKFQKSSHSLMYFLIYMYVLQTEICLKLRITGSLMYIFINQLQI